MIEEKTEQSSKETSWREDTVVPKAVRATRQKGRKGECQAIKIMKMEEKSEGYRRQLKERAQMKRGSREGEKVGEKESGERGYLKQGRSCAAA